MDFISVNSLEYIGVEGTVLYSGMVERKKKIKKRKKWRKERKVKSVYVRMPKGGNEKCQGEKSV